MSVYGLNWLSDSWKLDGKIFLFYTQIISQIIVQW